MGEEVFSISHTINALIYEKHSLGGGGGGESHKCPGYTEVSQDFSMILGVKTLVIPECLFPRK